MLKQRTIFYFWLPLALSWFLMTFEHPWVQGVVSRLGDAKLQLAALGLIISLMVLIETPIIMMLGTGAALARNRQSYRLLWRYMMFANTYVTIVALVMGFTPLLDWWLGTLVGVDQYIIDAVRPGIQIMAFWPALIGYRRFHQGVMIRCQNTRPIGYGTIVRLGGSAITAIVLGTFTNMPGAAVGAWAMMISALAELIFVMLVSRKNVQHLLDIELLPDETPLTYRKAFKFHFPLALTSVMTLLVRPVIERGLASTADPETTLAAWAIVFSILLIARSGGMAWQEGVIALSEQEDSVPALRRFTWTMGGIMTTILTVMAFTPLMTLYLNNALQIPAEVQPLVRIGAQIGILVPLLTALQSYYRGLLMNKDHTSPIYGAMMLSFGLTAVVMWVGIQMGVAGVALGVMGLVAGYLGELGILVWSLAEKDRKHNLTYAVATGD